MYVVQSLTILTCFIGALIVLAIGARFFWPDARELGRKIIHIGCGFLLPISWYLQLPKTVALIAASAATFLVFLNHKIRLFELIEDVKRPTLGTTFYCLSIVSLILIFWDRNPFAMLSGSLVMALSDGFASLIGQSIKSPKWEVLGQTKSLAGSLSMMLTTVIVLTCMQKISHVGLSLVQILLLSSFVACLEQWSTKGIDNLTVPLSTSFIWNGLTNSDQFF